MSSKNQSQLEGNGAAKLIQQMKRHGNNKEVIVELATVVTPPPSLSIRMNSDNLPVDSNEIIVAEHLTEHQRTISINGGSVTGTVTPSGNLTTFTLTDATMTIKSPLKAGDQVIVLTANDGQLYYVIDKAVL
ncbi:DUF2577 domain-containing protein [Bacillus sp. JJ1503]|uniref:DUF2577 domain-containing protein n=1 Tax=Bacillus sp. JJ1503 TaxID=3122956 RepID=UPI002FFF2984